MMIMINGKWLPSPDIIERLKASA